MSSCLKDKKGGVVKLMYLAIVLLSVFLDSYTVFAQHPYKPEVVDPLLEPWRWKFMPELRGKGVRCIESGADSSLWFGTDKGVCYYNGMDWQFYDTSNAKICFPVNAIVSTSEGKIYAGSERGLSVFEKGKWKFIFPKEKNELLNVNCLKLLANGAVLAGMNRGLIYISNDRTVFFTTSSNISLLKSSFPKNEFIILPDNYLFSGSSTVKVDDIFENSLEDLWILTSQSVRGKIFKFNIYRSLEEKKILDSDVQTEIAGNSLSRGLRAIQAQDGKVWIISAFYRSWVFVRDKQKWDVIRLSDLFGGDELHTGIMESRDGSIFIGGINKLYVYKHRKWNLYEAPQFPIPYSRVIFHESTDGSLWIAGMQNDVYRFDYGDSKWLTYNNLNFECESKDQKKWFLSVDNKVVVNDSSKWYYYNESDGLIDAPVRIITTKSGQIWVTGSHQSIAAAAYFDGTRWHRQVFPNLSWGIDYRAVFESIDGSLWLGASVDGLASKGQLAGVVCLKPQANGNINVVHYSSPHGIRQSNAYGIGQSLDGAIWMGGSQLLRFDGARWNTIDQPEYLKQFINCIYSSPEQNLWVGSRFYGLFAYDGKTWKQYNTDNGLSSNSIISIYARNDSCVWVATDNDICRFDGKTWTREIFHPQLLLTREGGELIESNDGSIWINKSLREWKRRAFTFNSAPKVAYENFRTVRCRPDKFPPKTTIQVYTKEVDHNGNTVISWAGKDFWEDTPSSQLAFSYRLNNGEWSPFEMQTYRTFTSLADGEYTFEVRARDIDFNIDSTPAMVKFTVSPAVWKQTWFILLVLAFISSIAFYEIQSYRRNRKLNRLNHSLSEINRELYLQKEAVVAKSNEIIEHQEKILEQKDQLEYSNKLLEQQNEEIKTQRDNLKDMVQQIEDLSQAKLVFFTNISHEFRTPLTLILGSIERLLSLKITDEFERFNLYGAVNRNANRLLRLINQILEFRKLEIGAVDFSPKTDDIVSFLKDLLNMFNGLANQRKIKLTFKAQENEIITAFDHDKLEKIIFNLLSNAFKFTPENGAITLEIKKEQVDKFIQIDVSDSGKGISPEHLPHIFERFYQVKEVQPSGTGIGLAYIKDLVEVHRGRISVKSELRKGSCFTLTIPIITQLDINDSTPEIRLAEQPVIAEDVSQDDGFNQVETLSSDEFFDSNDESTKVLIVEDDLELLAYLKSNLIEYRCIVAQNGKVGLEKAIKFQPDLIVSDVMMPEMDGIELCKLVKSTITISHIPVILLTARALVEHKIEGFESGADDYVEKPFNMQVLHARIRNLIESRKKLRELIRKEVIVEPSKVTVTSTDEKLLKGVMDLIEKNISEPNFNIEGLCSNFHLSRSHFSRKVKQITTYSPKELLNSYRLKRASQLIKENKITIAEISYMVGFEHPNSLSRAFRKQFGVSPTEYMNGNN
ncbi:MAG: ATP-binding protein [Bacteroidales bacterium]